jgi:hypothetical protein
MVDERERSVLDFIEANHHGTIDFWGELLAFKTIAFSIVRWSDVRENAGK